MLAFLSGLIGIILFIVLVAFLAVFLWRIKRSKSLVRGLSRLSRRLIPLRDRVDDAIMAMKERAVSLMKNAMELRRKSDACKNEKMKKRGCEIADKMEKKSKEIAAKVREYEEKKETLFAEKELLETVIEFCRLEKGLALDNNPYISLDELEKDIQGMEDELKALDTLF